MVMYDNELKTKRNKISTKDKIESQHIQSKKYNVTTLGVYSCTSNHDVKNSSALLVLLNLFIVLSLPDLKL